MYQENKRWKNKVSGKKVRLSLLARVSLTDFNKNFARNLNSLLLSPLSFLLFSIKYQENKRWKNKVSGKKVRLSLLARVSLTDFNKNFARNLNSFLLSPFCFLGIMITKGGINDTLDTQDSRLRIHDSRHVP